MTINAAQRQDKECNGVRHYLLNRHLAERRLAMAVRDHWISKTV